MADKLTANAIGHGAYWMYQGTRAEIEAWCANLKDPASLQITVTDDNGMKVGKKSVGETAITWGLELSE